MVLRKYMTNAQRRTRTYWYCEGWSLHVSTSRFWSSTQSHHKSSVLHCISDLQDNVDKQIFRYWGTSEWYKDRLYTNQELGNYKQAGRQWSIIWLWVRLVDASQQRWPRKEGNEDPNEEKGMWQVQAVSCHYQTIECMGNLCYYWLSWRNLRWSGKHPARGAWTTEPPNQVWHHHIRVPVVRWFKWSSINCSCISRLLVQPGRRRV
jgi:hypothetical protein